MIKNDIFTWCESVADEVYSYVDGGVFDNVDALFKTLCHCFKDVDVDVAFSGVVDELEVELSFTVMGNGVRVVLLFNNVVLRYDNIMSHERLIVESVVTSEVILTL